MRDAYIAQSALVRDSSPPRARRRWHPDKNPDDKERAEAEFKRIGEAMHTIEKGADADDFEMYDFDPMAMFMKVVQMQEMLNRAGMGGAGVGFSMGGDVFIMGGGTIMMLTTLRKLYYGVGKIELKD